MIALRNDQLCASCHFANETQWVVCADKVMTVAIWGNNQQKGPPGLLHHCLALETGVVSIGLTGRVPMVRTWVHRVSMVEG